MGNTKNYTQTEEFTHTFTHAIGALFAIYAMIMLATTATNFLQKTTVVIYASTMLILFLASTFYHAAVNKKVKEVFQKIDHSAIYLFIAGSYTPILMMTFSFPIAVFLILMIWCLSIAGIFFSCINLKSEYISTGLYLLLGWLSVVFAYTIWTKYPHYIMWMLLAGGMCFTAGSFFYLFEKKFMHAIWHIFVLAGIVIHYFCILKLLKI